MTTLGRYSGILRDDLASILPTMAPGATGYARYNLPRVGVEDKSTALTTQVMTGAIVYLSAGETVTNLTFLSGATAAGTPTNWWFALYNTAATPALIAQTADQTTGAWAANTAQTKALSAAYTVPTSGFYIAACMVKATTVPSLIGATCARPLLTGDRVLAQTSGSSLAATAPATWASPATSDFVPLVAVT